MTIPSRKKKRKGNKGGAIKAPPAPPADKMVGPRACPRCGMGSMSTVCSGCGGYTQVVLK